jgi:two-component system response regulator ChvI
MSDGRSLDGGKVLLVEDDHHYREILSDELSERGFSVQSFGDGESLLGALDTAADADVVVLDWKLPRTSGIDLLPQLRHRGVNLPVVFLTAHALAGHEILAFERGATDFIDKGRGLDVLVRRLKSAIKAFKPAADSWSDNVIASGRLVLRPGVNRAYWDDIDVGLTRGEYNIIHLLASNAGRYVTYRAIYDCLHYVGFIAGTGDDGYRANVRSAFKRIRSKFRELDSSFAEIENYTAFGYCWRRPSED